LFLACDRSMDVVERFPVQQPLDPVFIRESFDTVVLVFKDALVQVTGHADVESSRQASHNISAVRLSLVRHERG